MQKIVEDLESKVNAFIINAKKLTNASAGRRARKLSHELTKDFKQYRRLSVEAETAAKKEKRQ